MSTPNWSRIPGKPVITALVALLMSGASYALAQITNPNSASGTKANELVSLNDC